MKKLIVSLSAIAALAPAFAMAADEHDRHAGQGAMHADAAPAGLIEGRVKKVDKAAGTLTVSQGPLPNVMPAMTMAFKVRNIVWLDTVKDGQKIRFTSDTVEGAMTIVRLESVK